MEQDRKIETKLLEDVKYFSTGILSQQVQQLLSDGGAKCFKYASDMMSHCIAGDEADNSAIEEARDIFEKPVVTPTWIMMSVQARKLLPVEPFDPKIPPIFKKVIASVSQISKHDAKKLWALLEIYGGKLKPAFNTTCSHLICGKASGAKYEEGLKHSNIAIVTPDWIVDCISERTLLPVERYHPSLLIDPTKVLATSSCTEELKVLKIEPEKSDEIKPTPVVPMTPVSVPTKVVEIPRRMSEASEVVVKKEIRIEKQETTHHIVTNTNPRMRVASNLPPHLEQQLQQHSMMRNTAPRQQQGQVRMLRSVSNAQGNWRPANQQQQIILQRSVSHPGSQGDQRPQQILRPTYTVQQIRTPQQAGSSDDGKVQHLIVSQQLGSVGNQQIGMVRQVKLINQQVIQTGVQQQVILHPPQTHQTLGEAQNASVQQSWIQQTPGTFQSSNPRMITPNSSQVKLQQHQTLQPNQQSVQLPSNSGVQQPQIASNAQQVQVQFVQQGSQQHFQHTTSQQGLTPGHFTTGQTQELQPQQESAAQQQKPYGMQQNYSSDQQLSSSTNQIAQQFSLQQSVHQQQGLQHPGPSQPIQQAGGLKQAIQPAGSQQPIQQGGPQQPLHQPGGPQQPMQHSGGSQEPMQQPGVPQQPMQQPGTPQQPMQQQGGPQQPMLQQSGPQQPVQQPSGPQQPMQQPGTPQQPMQQGAGPQHQGGQQQAPQQQGGSQQPMQQPASLSEGPQQQVVGQVIIQQSGHQNIPQHGVPQPNQQPMQNLVQQGVQQQSMNHPMIRQIAPGQFVGPQGTRPAMQVQVGPGGQPVQQPVPPRPLTPQQQQLLQSYIQSMTPQQRQQLQQMTPQMRYSVLQKILAQQEMQMQQTKRLQQQQSSGQSEEVAQPGNVSQQELAMKRQQLMQQQQQMLQRQGQLPIRQPFPQQQQQVGQRMPLNNVTTWQQQPDQSQILPNHQVQQMQQQAQVPCVPQIPQLPQQQQIQHVQLQVPQSQPNQQAQVISHQQPQQPHQAQQTQQVPQPQQVSQQLPQQILQAPQQLQASGTAAQMQQQQEQQSNSVNPKTKTALANLLSTRLQTTPAQQPPQQVNQQQQQQYLVQQQQQQRRNANSLTNGTNGNSQPPNPLISTANPAAPQLQQQQPQMKGNPGVTMVRMPVNAGPGHVAMGPGPVGPPGGPTVVAVRRDFPGGPQPFQQPFLPNQPQQHQLFGHEPGMKVPEHLCLLGCVFFIVDYQRTIAASELQKWVKLMCAKGAEVESTYGPRVTHLLCETTRTAVVQQALRDGKRLVSAFWLNDTILKDQLFPPTLVLHFPTPYTDMDRPCKGMLASISGFEGEDRARVRYMCETIGLTYTGHFSSHHDVLICRKADGPKYQKAREWRKPVVTLNWLAEIHFGFVNALNQMHHPKYQQFNLPAYVQDPFKFELNMAGSLLAAWRIPIKVTPDVIDKFNKQGAVTAAAHLRMRNKRNLSTNSNPGDSPSKKKAKNFDLADGSDADRVCASEKSSNLDAILDDVAKGGFDAEGKPRPLVRFSGLDATEWSKNLLKLGGCLAGTNREATHLVMPTLMRTPKFLSCVPTVKFVLTPQWIKDSIQNGKLLDEEPYIHKEANVGGLPDFNIGKLLAQPNRDQLFKGKTFYITPSVVPSRSVLREIIENSGGKVALQRKSLKSITDMNQVDGGSYVVISCAQDFHLVADLIKSKTGVYHSEYVMNAVLTQTIHGTPFLIGP